MTEIGIEVPFCKLSPDILLRQEIFGGLVFNRKNGDLLEIDRAAYRFLALARDGVRLNEAISQAKSRHMPGKHARSQVVQLCRDLLDLGVLVIEGELTPPDTLDSSPQVDHHSPSAPFPPALSAPEAVHWAITYRCSQSCPDCYAARICTQDSSSHNELDTEGAFNLVDRIQQWGAFQLAIGGGEPFSRSDLPDIVRHAHDSGLAVHVTTALNPSALRLLPTMMEHLSCIQIGIHPETLFSASRDPHQKRLLSALLPQLAENGSTDRIGANLMLNRTILRHLEDAVSVLIHFGFSKITFLRYKPPASVQQWEIESPSVEELGALHDRIAAIQLRHPGLSIRVDCGLSFLERKLPREQARLHGYRGCVAGSRIVALTPDGSVYPCSQLVASRFRAGNLLYDDPKELWAKSSTLKRFRHLREKRTFRETLCGSCLARDWCSGCRVFSHDVFGADPGCPEPVLAPLRHLGKAGRVADAARFISDWGPLTQQQYKNRYGVAKRRAIAEMNHLGISDGYDLIGDIQDSIGCTSGGAPFASREEIKEWISEDSGSYPKWLKREWEERHHEDSEH